MIQNSALLSRNLNSSNNSERKRANVDFWTVISMTNLQIWSLPSLEVKSLLYLFRHLVRFTLLNCSLLLFCLTRGLVLLSMEEMLFWHLTPNPTFSSLYLLRTFVSWIKDDWHHVFSILESNSKIWPLEIGRINSNAVL